MALRIRAKTQTMAEVPDGGPGWSALWHDVRSVVTGVASTVIVWVISSVRKAIANVMDTQQDHEKRLTELERERKRKSWEDKP